ncbi:MAG: recombinase family protein, partial [Actinomyces sp.]|nr:recombinase family protein [Actinomyces sp.]
MLKHGLHEDEAAIGAFFEQHAKAMSDDAKTRVMLLEYFVDKIFTENSTLTAVSCFYDHGDHVRWEELVETKNSKG